MAAPTPGHFITFEGVEGCGKTTQILRLADRLRARGVPVTLTREPGGTPFGQAVRRVLLDPVGPPREPAGELLLYLADRCQDLAQCIRPALAAGQVVLCDRYHDATLAYQGAARGIARAVIDRLAAALDILTPDLTFLLDIDPERSLARAIARNAATAEGAAESRFEGEALAFHRAVRAGYLELARREPARFAVIDADRAPDPIFADIAARADALLAGRRREG
ncbi:MAG TPA: dTMP kinase [Acidobacteriota bacterium]|nr:dTMP kinase [Acidobacteriota bacterium]HOB54561.1 dTMP kinase [Acidobacteriota bacterium]HQM63838.1 dTMP kinase [Acidobacteriota bacterium]HQO27129.1 dTMP kinase [Acidobacteriota bacterium]HQP75383.1 dTMP kinase [Acidobacteriota bacterium]